MPVIKSRAHAAVDDEAMFRQQFNAVGSYAVAPCPVYCRLFAGLDGYNISQGDQLSFLQFLGKIAREAVAGGGFFLEWRIDPRMQMNPHGRAIVIGYGFQEVSRFLILDNGIINEIDRLYTISLDERLEPLQLAHRQVCVPCPAERSVPVKFFLCIDGNKKAAAKIRRIFQAMFG